jgi:hypothetical protein
MGHTQMDIVLACLDDYALEHLLEQLRERVYESPRHGDRYERERLMTQYLGVVVESEIRRADAASSSSAS